MSTISKRKYKRFDIEAYYRNKSKIFWFGPLTIGTKAKHFYLVPHFFRKQIVSILAQKFWDEAKQFDMIWDIVLGKVERYYLIQNLIDQSKTFDLVRLLSERKYNTPLTISYKTKTDNFCQVSSKNCCKYKKSPYGAVPAYT